MIVHVLLVPRLLRPVPVVGDRWLSEPIVCIRGLHQSVCPAFSEEPPSLTGGRADSIIELSAIDLFHVFGGLVARKLFHDPSFRSVYLDISRFGTVGGIVGVCATDVCDLQDHVGLPMTLCLAVPKADADVLHTIA